MNEIVTRDFKSEADCELNKEEHKFEISGEGWLKCKVCGELKFKEGERNDILSHPKGWSI